MSDTDTTTDMLTIGELASQADVTPRTIRYYTSEGLLPPPHVQGKYTRYTADYVQRLRLIARLKAAYLPLNEIRDRIAALDTEGVEAMLRELGEMQPAAAPAPESASDYITGILEQQKRSSQLPRPAPPAPMAPPPAPAGAPAPSAPPPAAPKQAEGFLRRLIAPKPSVEEAAHEHWQRIPLAPGVELHIRSDIQEQAQKQIQKLIEHARSIFRS
ncbi:MerR family transcriptional regulator [Chloroflexia bacterium SDU3-3]|nr:MerR family transcriptional regulator [Chloroflexia bacterium SDU3-3]